jgi:hypothetical protein
MPSVLRRLWKSTVPAMGCEINWGAAPASLAYAVVFHSSGGPNGGLGPQAYEYVERIRVGRSAPTTNARWHPEGIDFWAAGGDFAQQITLPQSDSYLGGFQNECTVSWRQWNQGDNLDRPVWNHADSAGNGFSCRAPFSTTTPTFMFDWEDRWSATGQGELYSGWHSLMVSGSTGLVNTPDYFARGWKDGIDMRMTRATNNARASDIGRPFNIGGLWVAGVTNPFIGWISHWYAFYRSMRDDGLAAQLHEFPYFFFNEPVARHFSFGSAQAWVTA